MTIQTSKMTCIVCQTNPINPQIGPSFCSRLCEYLWSRIDLQFTPAEQMKRIALKEHEDFKAWTNTRHTDSQRIEANREKAEARFNQHNALGKCYCSICQGVDADSE